MSESSSTSIAIKDLGSYAVEYIVTNSDEITDIWLGVFEALSVQHFKWFTEELKFPYDPPEDLKNIAIDFVISVLSILGESTPQELSIQLIRNGELDDDSLQAIWTSTFNQLEALGYASDVYNWVKQTHWKILSSESPLLSTSKWYHLLFDWSCSPENEGFLPLQLTHKTATSLQLLILKTYISTQDLRIRILTAQQSPGKNQWDQYAFEYLQVGSWFSNYAQFLISLDHWKLIFELLTAEEINIIENWGKKQFNKVGVKNRISLREIKEHLY